MAMTSYKTPTLAELAEAYRRSFKEFVQKLRQVQSLKTIPDKNAIGVAIASLELEKARTAYYSKRDALVEQLLSTSRMRRVQVPAQSGWRLAHQSHP